MPDKKLTDKEIVKALDEAELFLRNRVMDGKPLKLNEYDIGILRNISQVCAKAYDEINRLQAENESLTRNCVSYKVRWAKATVRLDTAKAENERLKDYKQLYEDLKAEHLETIKLINKGIKTAKAEAYKEFAERLCEDRVSNDPVVIAAKCLLKELVGEDK